MAYLNCPFCPAQSFPDELPYRVTQYVVQQMFKCSANHKFYVDEEDISDARPEQS